MVLTAQIQKLSEELSLARTQLEEIYSSGQVKQRMEYEERERKYTHIIREMKEQLKARENVVPMGLYRSEQDAGVGGACGGWSHGTAEEAA